MITFPIWFDVILAAIGTYILLAIWLILSRHKIITVLNSLPAERKHNVVDRYARMVGMLKLSLWIAPVNMILMPAVSYLYFPDYLFHVTVIFSALFAVILVSFIFRSQVLKGIMS